MSLFGDCVYVASSNLPEGCPALPGNSKEDKKSDESDRLVDEAIDLFFSSQEFEDVIEKFYAEICIRVYDRIKYESDVNFKDEVEESIEYFRDQV